MSKQLLCTIGVLVLVLAPVVWAQTQPTTEHAKVEAISGEVISMSSESLVIRTEDDRRLTFVVGEDTELPEPLVPGSAVRVEYEIQEDGTLHAVNVVPNVRRDLEERSTASSGSREQGSDAVTADTREIPEEDNGEPAAGPSRLPPQSGSERDGLQENQAEDGLPATASPLPLMLVSGFLAFGGGVALRAFRWS